MLGRASGTTDVAGAKSWQPSSIRAERLSSSLTSCVKIGIMFGNPETTTGGRAEVLCKCPLDVRHAASIRAIQIGSRTRVKVVKNKVVRSAKRNDILFGRESRRPDAS